MKTIDHTQLASITGGAGGWWLARHPYAAAIRLAGRPFALARFDARHPIAGAYVNQIQQSLGIG